MMDGQLDFLGTGKNLYQAEQNRDVGVLMSEAHANDAIEKWSDMALVMIEAFLAYRTSDPFLAEDVRSFATANGLPEPPCARAWGAVIKRASDAGLIAFSGYGKTSNPKAHRTPAALWKKNIK